MLVRIARVVVLATALTIGGTTVATSSALATGTTAGSPGTTSVVGGVVKPMDIGWCC